MTPLTWAFIGFVLAVCLLALLARRYVVVRLYISGDHGDARPIGDLPDIQKMVNVCCGRCYDRPFSLVRWC